MLQKEFIFGFRLLLRISSDVFSKMTDVCRVLSGGKEENLKYDFDELSSVEVKI
jgi:hypothetical protein